MKYLKLYELFSDKHIPFTLTGISDNFCKYSFVADDDKYDCIFSFSKTVRYWERFYYNSSRSDSMPYDEVNKNPYNIVSTITNITIDFLNRFNPNILTIDHIYMDNEKFQKEKLNKRANINYQYLKNYLTGYKIDYYNIFGSTICLIYKEGFDYTNVLKSINSDDDIYKISLK